MVVIGPSNLEIMGVPTRWFCHLDSFRLPIKEVQDYSKELWVRKHWVWFEKYGLLFKPMGQHFDLSTQFDIYTRGSWGVQISSNTMPIQIVER